MQLETLTLMQTLTQSLSLAWTPQRLIPLPVETLRSSFCRFMRPLCTDCCLSVKALELHHYFSVLMRWEPERPS